MWLFTRRELFQTFSLLIDFKPKKNNVQRENESASLKVNLKVIENNSYVFEIEIRSPEKNIRNIILISRLSFLKMFSVKKVIFSNETHFQSSERKHCLIYEYGKVFFYFTR